MFSNDICKIVDTNIGRTLVSYYVEILANLFIRLKWNVLYSVCVCSCKILLRQV